MTKSFCILYGFLFSINFGPYELTKYKYIAIIVRPGTGDFMRGQSFVLGSTFQILNDL
jgi:hypothetical protein